MNFGRLLDPARKLRNQLRYPTEVSVSLLESTVRFRVTNDVERHRATDFGGEKSFLNAFLDYVDEETLLWDVGANIGLFSLFAASDGAAVHAFEPESAFRGQLVRNIELNSLAEAITVHGYALGESAETVTLYTDGIDGNSPSLVDTTDGDRDAEEITIRPGRSVDAPTPDIIKIDVEGAETEVLLGLGGTLAEIETVALELHPEMIVDYGRTPEEPLKLLREAGFEIRWEQVRNEQRQIIAVRNSDS